MNNLINCKTYRRFGVEVELNTTTGVIKRWDIDEGETPDGSDYVSCIINKATGDKVVIHGWHHTHNNNIWIVKSDRSCGIEVCSPVLKGWSGQKKIIKAIDYFNKNDLKSDNRCSLHIHVNIDDFTKYELASVISYWVKCEHVFLDAMPDIRKNNRYCQMIGMSDIFKHDFNMNIDDIIDRVSDSKYYTINAYHLKKGGGMEASVNSRRKTIEFRIAENNICINPWDAKNWIRLIIHFVERVKRFNIPSRYRSNDPWSGLLWLDPKDVFKILGFDEELSPGLIQVKNWFIERLLRYGYDSSLGGIWSNSGRKSSRNSLFSIIDSSFDRQLISKEITDEMLYGKKYIL